MQQAHGMVCVWLNVRPEHEEEFTAWYETEHVRDVIAIDGFISGRRYYDENSKLRFLALYEAGDEKVEPGPGFQGMVADPSPWTHRIRTLFGDMRLRSNYRRIADTGTAAEPGAIITVHTEGKLQAGDAEARRAALPGCLRLRVFHEADRPDRGFEIYDFASRVAADAARARLKSGPGIEIAVRTAIGEPHVH
jgi:hypothetical protein